MHYALDEFGRFDKQTKRRMHTIEVLAPYKDLAYFCGQRLFFSYLDAQAVAERYGETSFPIYTRLDTRSWPASQLEYTFPLVSDASKGATFYDIAVPGPATVSNVTFSTSSEKAGDCDLYVRRVPMVAEQDFTKPEHFASPLRGNRVDEWRSVKSRSNEQVSILNGSAGAVGVRYLVMVHAYKAYQDVALKVRLTRR
jgi:hypothetical protein